MKKVKIQSWDSVYTYIGQIMGEYEGQRLYNKWWHSGYDMVFWQIAKKISIENEKV